MGEITNRSGYSGSMKHRVHIYCLALLIMPTGVLAEETPQNMPDDTLDAPFAQGLELLRGGAELLLQDLLSEVEPALKSLEDLALELDAYDAPVVLPNGDILIRRKTPMDQDRIPKSPTPPLPRDHIEIDPMPRDEIDL